MTHDPEVVVIGNALPERIRVGKRDLIQLGGVGAIMAQELAHQGEDPLFITPVGTGPTGVELLDFLNDAGLRCQPVPADQPAAWAELDLRPGGRSRGQWPTYSWYDIKAAATKVLEGGWPHDNRWLLLDCSFTTKALGGLLCLAQTNRWRVIINGTTKYRCKRIGGSAVQGRPLHAVTLNRQEMEVMTRMCGSRTPPDRVRRMLGGAKYLLNTRDRQGWTLYQEDENEVSRPAEPLPRDAHCIGAGDAATAGLAHALIRGLNPAPAINKAVRDRLRHNAAAD